MDTDKNHNILINKISNNSYIHVWDSIVNEEKVDSLISQMKLITSCKSKYEEFHQKLNKVKVLTEKLLPSSVFNLPIKNWNQCEINNYVNNQLQTIEKNYILEESDFIKDHLKIDPILDRKRKRSADDANLNSKSEGRMESYKRSRFQEKVKRMTRNLREDFINKKLNESNSALKKISELIVQQNTDLISPPIVINETIFQYF